MLYTKIKSDISHFQLTYEKIVFNIDINEEADSGTDVVNCARVDEKTQGIC